MGYANPEDKLEWQRKNRAKKRAAGIKEKNYHPPGYKFYTKEEYNAWQREYRRNQRIVNPEKASALARNSALKLKYGITDAVYQKLFADQNGVCAICQNPERVKQKGKAILLAVDHNHTTGEIRGLLCSVCNRGLGLLGDCTATLLAAVAYLKDFDEGN